MTTSPLKDVIPSCCHRCISLAGGASSRSGSVQHEASSTDEYSHSSQATNSTSPGTHSTQSTTVLSTFQPYPLGSPGDVVTSDFATSSMSSSSQRSSHDPYTSSSAVVTSPHNLSSQPLLSDYESYGQPQSAPRSLTHSVSHDQQLYQQQRQRAPGVTSSSQPRAKQHPAHHPPAAPGSHA